MTQAHGEEHCGILCRHRVMALAAPMLTTLSSPAQAQDAVPVEQQSDLSGMTLELAYTGDLQTVMRGGIRRGTRYLDLFELAAEKRFPIGDDTFIALRSAIGVRALKPLLNEELLDAVIPSSTVDDTSGVRLIEAWAEFGREESVKLRLGAQEIDTDFAKLQANEFFVNDAHQLGPDILYSGEGEAPSFPAARLGARLSVPVGSTTAKLAVFDGVPTYGTDARRPDFHLSAREGAFVIGEVEHRFATGARVAGGAWGFTSPIDRSNPDESAGAQRGAYGLVEVPLGRSCAGADNQCWVAWTRFGMAGPANSTVTGFIGGGLLKTGLFKDRPEDRFGVAFAHADLATGYGLKTPETNYEISYAFRLTDTLVVQPDLQWIIHPGGERERGDALVMGIRIKVDFATKAS